MLSKKFKIFFILLLLYQFPIHSKSTYNNDFKSKEVTNYFSALVSIGNYKNDDALKFFNSSKTLINKHDLFLKQYVFSLITGGKINQAIKELKYNLENKNSDFFEAHFLLMIDSIKKKDFKKSEYYLKRLSKYKSRGTLELVIYESFKDYIYLFKNKKILSNVSDFGNLSMINKTFQNCYIGTKLTDTYFLNLINSNEVDYSRYIFFYINYLIENDQFFEAKEMANEINTLSSSLLISQTKDWINEKRIDKFRDIFSCKRELDILSEFLFIISNLYSTQNNFKKSNFYLNISNFLNPKFSFNLTLLAENYYTIKDYKQSKRILNKLNDKDDLYYFWYNIKKKANIISQTKNKEEAFDYINLKFQKIKQPTIKILFDMANISKNFKKYKLAISYYNKILPFVSNESETYADLLYRRGGSYERLGEFEKSDDDLLKSLEIMPNDAYVLNYLAYSWLERDYNIDEAITMLEKAYKQKKDDPYILDSVGWAYYLVGNFIKAEEFMKKAIQLMPDDPIVNDHYGDILWMLNRKIQAKYYWMSVLDFDDTEEKMKEEVNTKLLRGPEKI
jgi:tetratricopeptide (TPR) repeat protein